MKQEYEKVVISVIYELNKQLKETPKSATTSLKGLPLQAVSILRDYYTDKEYKVEFANLTDGVFITVHKYTYEGDLEKSLKWADEHNGEIKYFDKNGISPDDVLTAPTDGYRRNRTVQSLAGVPVATIMNYNVLSLCRDIYNNRNRVFNVDFEFKVDKNKDDGTIKAALNNDYSLQNIVNTYELSFRDLTYSQLGQYYCEGLFYNKDITAVIFAFFSFKTRHCKIVVLTIERR